MTTGAALSESVTAAEPMTVIFQTAEDGLGDTVRGLGKDNSSKEAASLLLENALMLHIAISNVHYAQERVLAGKLANTLGYGGEPFFAALLKL